MHARDQPGTLDFPNGTGQIKEITELPDGLWSFKRDGAYRAAFPDAIDPERKNPQLPIQKYWYPELGASNPLVARLFIQPVKILHEMGSSETREKIAFRGLLLEDCRTMLSAAKRLDGFVEKVKALEIVDGKQQRGFFPSIEIPGLDEVNAVAGDVLAYFKRLCQSALNIPVFMLNMPQMGNPNFDKRKKDVEDKYGDKENLSKVIAFHRDALVEMVDMRNAIEHPREGQSFSVIEPRLSANGDLQQPKILFTHKGKTVEREMIGYLNDVGHRVLDLCEEIFACCAEKKDIGTFPFVVYEIEKGERDPECPVRYQGRYWFERPTPLPGESKKE